MSKQIEPVRHKGVVVNITNCQTTKDGVVYESYQVSDYSSGKRKRWTFASPDEAKKKAKEIAVAAVTGQHSVLTLSPYESEIRAAFEALPPDIRLGRAAEIVRACCQIVDPDEILVACRFWRENHLDRKFTAKRAGEAVAEYLARQGRLSQRRQETLATYLAAFSKCFAGKTLDEITTAGIRDWIDSKTSWKSPKTRNEVRCAVGLLYQDAVERGYVGKGYNPVKEIKAEKVKSGEAGVFMPEQVRQVLHNVEDELALPMALWFFGSLRKENLVRIQWPALKAALKTGFLKIAAHEDLKTGARTVALEQNMRSWIEWFLSRHPDASGLVLPPRHSENRKIDNLTRKIVCRSKVTWVDNAPRHSCISMRIARGDNVQSIAKAAGNSLSQIQKHYWNKSDEITAAIANEYFSIVPLGITLNIDAMPKPDGATERSRCRTRNRGMMPPRQQGNLEFPKM